MNLNFSDYFESVLKAKFDIKFRKTLNEETDLIESSKLIDHGIEIEKIV